MSAAVPQGHPDRVGAQPDHPAAKFTPYIPPETRLRELGALPIIVGTILGMIFGASSLYLVLKVGLTVSASIPVAVISITLFRLLSKIGVRRRDHPREQHRADRGLGRRVDRLRRRRHHAGDHDPRLRPRDHARHAGRVLGGLLGILMMIPLRRALIVAQHGILKYPEGTACAEVLKAGASAESRAAASAAAKREQEALGGAGTSAKTIFTGFGIGLVYKTAMVAFTRLEGRAEQGLRPAVQRRLGVGRDLARAARRRLHHRPAHRRDHVRGRRARVPGADPADQVLRRRP